MSDLDITGESSRTVTAFFDYEADAKTAYNSLLHAGLSEEDVHLTAGRQDTDDEVTGAEQPEHHGFFASLANFFMGDEDRHTYAEGLQRGGYLIVVDNLDSTMHDTAVDILDREGAVDIDERAEEWRSSGWTGSNASAGVIPAASIPTGTANRSLAADSGEAIPVVDEQLLVGKRDVNLGRVRVRSYLQETPVTEQVNLRDERVTLERRPVDRPVTAADGDAFAERAIEAEEHTEQAVVSKQARVVEEVTLQKDVAERTETVSDTVRHTEIEVDDERNKGIDVKSKVQPKP